MNNENMNNKLSNQFKRAPGSLTKQDLINTPSSFKEKINQLIKKIGNDYVDIIENDLSIFEELM